MVVHGQLLLSLVVIHVSLNAGVDGAGLNPFGYVGSKGSFLFPTISIGNEIDYISSFYLRIAVVYNSLSFLQVKVDSFIESENGW